jgi:hypothetical protein
VTRAARTTRSAQPSPPRPLRGWSRWASQTAPRRVALDGGVELFVVGLALESRHLFCQHAGHCDQVSQDRRIVDVYAGQPGAEDVAEVSPSVGAVVGMS